MTTPEFSLPLNVVPVLLCGGSGTRLWPLSRKSYPKQFAPLLGPQSLFQATAKRLSGTDFAAPIVVTASDFRFIVTEQLAGVGVDPGVILIEPEARNTAPAILAAVLHVSADAPDALMLFSPTDHAMPDGTAFHEAIAQAIPAALDGQIVTFGIAPSRAETGYGWLELEGAVVDGPVPLKRFIEKPDPEHAAAMLLEGGYLWNAGIFLATARTMLAAFEAHAADLIAPVTEALAAALPDLGFLRLNQAAWCNARDASIDYAVMEQAGNLAVVPFAGDWSDLGDWNAVWRALAPDAGGVATAGAATAIDCHDTLLRSEAEGLEIVGIGLDGIVAIAMPDAVLVADKSRAQEVRLAVAALSARSAKQATEFPRDHRPWGWFETLAVSERFQVKRIVVHPGAALSLQSHVRRAEHWIVVSGTAKVTIDAEVRLLSENQSVYIPLGAVHRMENPGRLPMVLIEVQTGAYLGEDDIVRYDDIYAR